MITQLSLIPIMRLHYRDIYKKLASLNVDCFSLCVVKTWDGSGD
jgi:hypothetical protein